MNLVELKDLLDSAQAAKLLGVSPQHVSLLARRGKLPGVLVLDREWRFRREDVLAYDPPRRRPRGPSQKPKKKGQAK